MLNHVNGGVEKELHKYSDVTVHVWLGKGDHYLFWCSDG